MVRKLFWLLILSMLATVQGFSQIDEERSVQIFATYDTVDQQLSLNWKPSPQATGYRISRWENNAWIIKGSVGQSDTSFNIDDHQIGEVQEYRVQANGGLGGTGYIYAGFEVMPTVQDRRCLLLVDSILMSTLPDEIDRWVRDVNGDGWQVSSVVCQASESVREVKQKITAWYNDDPFAADLTVFILGNVAVPYSGEINPDAHNNHIGAWPCDGYYGDIQDFVWTDNRVNNTTASDSRNHNVPGDGKFDQSSLPSQIEIQVGRVDLFDLPAFSEDYIELSRQYLEKNHAFRTGALEVPRRALIENNFGNFQEGFAQNGWKNFAAMVGPGNVIRGDYENDLENESYLLAYACGGGSHTSMGGVGNTNTVYVDRDIQAVFVMNFGSYFGDWDRTNNFMRASLASGNILTNAWAGRPNWQFHHMALGRHVGYSAIISQNNSIKYTPGFFAGLAHVSLLGDPTLRLHPVKPPQDLQLTEDNGHINLLWTASTDAGEGYMVYRRTLDGNEEALTTMPIQATSYSDSCVMRGELYRYTVKAVRLEESASGSYYNSSVGVSDTIRPTGGSWPVATFDWNANYESVEFQSTSSMADSILWDFGNGDTSTDTAPEYIFSGPGPWVICLEVFNDCGSSRDCDTLMLESSLPDQYSVESMDVLCHGESNGALSFVHSPSPALSYDWSNGSTDSTANGLSAGLYSLRVTSVSGLEIVLDSLRILEPSPLIVDVMTTPSSGQDGTATATVSGGTPPYMLTWGDGTIDPSMLPPGMYVLTVVDSNECETEVSFEVDVRTSVSSQDEEELKVYPNPSSNDIHVIFRSGVQWEMEGVTDPSGTIMEGFNWMKIEDGIMVNVRKLPPGSYWMILKSKGERRFVPFIRS